MNQPFNPPWPVRERRIHEALTRKTEKLDAAELMFEDLEIPARLRLPEPQGG